MRICCLRRGLTWYIGIAVLAGIDFPWPKDSNRLAWRATRHWLPRRRTVRQPA